MIIEIWQSFRRLPLWVQLWVSVVLVPVNLASLAFLDAPQGTLVALLAVAGMAPNLLIMIRDHGFSRAMAIPHLIFWVPLVGILTGLLTGDDALPETYRLFLIALLVIDAISLAFDASDTLRWWRGERGAA